jgi:uncharacterized protein YdeI (YjbR/CyaY-like superfamily)
LFRPVKAEIRKKIKKKEGDYVHVILYADNGPTDVPEEMLICLQDEPKAERFFNSLSDNEKQNYIKWIYSAKKEEIKVQRMVRTVNRLMKRLKYYDNPKK